MEHYDLAKQAQLCEGCCQRCWSAEDDIEWKMWVQKRATKILEILEQFEVVLKISQAERKRSEALSNINLTIILNVWYPQMLAIIL